MTVHRYRAAAADQQGDPIEFEVEFPDPDNPTTSVVESFKVGRPFPAVPVIDLALVEAEATTEAQVYLAVVRCLRALLGAEQWERFRVAAGHARFTIDHLVEIVRDLLELSERPTEPSSGSAGSGSSGSTSSNDGATTVGADPFSRSSEDSPAG